VRITNKAKVLPVTKGIMRISVSTERLLESLHRNLRHFLVLSLDRVHTCVTLILLNTKINFYRSLTTLFSFKCNMFSLHWCWKEAEHYAQHARARFFCVYKIKRLDFTYMCTCVCVYVCVYISKNIGIRFLLCRMQGKIKVL